MPVGDPLCFVPEEHGDVKGFDDFNAVSRNTFWVSGKEFRGGRKLWAVNPVLLPETLPTAFRGRCSRVWHWEAGSELQTWKHGNTQNKTVGGLSGVSRLVFCHSVGDDGKEKHPEKSILSEPFLFERWFLVYFRGTLQRSMNTSCSSLPALYLPGWRQEATAILTNPFASLSTRLSKKGHITRAFSFAFPTP
ncbi:MAG: uncharacterized protein A8A55_1008 [Amphiamblys sp. WSBS2006]|nr:MAG: uncharacterized protein A8A55_1008 [Amphiamblys sp. WSBS2006]